MTSDDGNLLLPDVPASSSSSVNTSGSINSVDSVDEEQEQQEHQETVTATTVPTTNHNRTRSKSIAHDDWVHGRSIIFHVDLEHGGDACGVIQLSVVAYDPTGHKVVGEFNDYIKPPTNAFWSSHASAVHGIYPTDIRILSAMGIKEVWKRFVSFIEGLLDEGSKKGIIAAWGGQSCDCEWLFRITEDTHHGELFMPRWCPYFMDPKKIVSHYTSCKLNQKHSSVIGYGCDEMWCYVTGNDSLPGAHSAIVDARAQSAIVADSRFWEFIDRPASMIPMIDVWAAKRKNRDLRNEELRRKIPSGWTEGVTGSAWKLPRAKDYTFAGGGLEGPTIAAKTVCESQSLVDLFVFFFPIQFLDTIAQETNRYANEDWVRSVKQNSTTQADDDNNSDGDDDDEPEEDDDGPKTMAGYYTQTISTLHCVS
jgi:hypothetical protein